MGDCVGPSGVDKTMGTEKFCLKWNDFEGNISLAFRDIREEKDFFDCTLSCGARQVQANKIILAACSPFFRSTLRQNPHQHPLLYLKGVEFNDLQAVLTFMYHGEVNVAQEQLNSFLSVAEDLQVKGLTQNKDDTPSHTNHQDDTRNSIPRPPRPNKSSLPGRYQAGVQDVIPEIKQETASQVVAPVQDADYPAEQGQHEYQAHSEVQPVEEYEEVEYTREEFGEQAGYEVDTFADNPEYTCADIAVESLLVHQSPGCYTCASCGKTSAQRTDLMKHIISKHVVSQAIACQFCGKKYKNQNSLQVHISQNHRELWQQAKKMG